MIALLAGLPWLRMAPWLLAGLGLAGTLWYRAEALSCQASVAIEAAKAAERVAAAKEADAKFTRGLEEQLQPLRDAIRNEAHATVVALSKVRSDPNCAATPAARAFDGGLRPSGQPSGAGR